MNGCVSPEDAALLIEGALDDAAAAAIDRHVADCDRCRRMVAAAADTGDDTTEPGAAGEGRPAPGDRIGRYRLVEPIGRGGMGVVFRGRDETLGRDVAIKLIRIAGADAAARALREARALARLSHPNVVAIHDAGEHDGATFLAMELVPGRTLTEWLAAPRPAGEVLAVIADVARGLAAAHRAGLVHRDVKPGNVLVGDDGRSRIADFGLARGPGGGASGAAVPGARAADATDPRHLVGTPAYMAPEQLAGGEVDARTDQFALAQTAWEALFGAAPFPITPAAERLAAIRGGRITEPAAERRARVPRHVEPSLRRALAADPAARFRDVEHLAAALAPRRRRRAAAAITVAVVAAGAGVAAWAASPAPRAAPEAPPPAGPLVPETLLALPSVTDLDLTADGGAALWVEAGRVILRGLDGRPDAALDVPGARPLAAATFAADQRVLLSFADGSIDAWRPGADPVPVAPAGTGRAIGTAWDGRIVVAHAGADAVEVRLAGDGRADRVATLAGKALVRHGGLSPDRRRLAAVVAGREQHVVVLDLATGEETARWPVELAVAVAWRDDARLLIARGWRPTVVDEHRLDAAAPPRRIHEVAGGQLTVLLGRGGRAFLVEVRAVPSVRLHGIGPAREPSREISGGRAAIGLAWDAGGAAWVWDGGGRQLVGHALDGAERFVQLAGAAPVGAGTRAGDAMILAPTRHTDCAVRAVALADGAERWRRAVSCKAVVRCAGDAAPPCVLVDWPERDRYEVARIDAADGTVGEVLFAGATFPNGLADAALSPDGATLAIVDSRSHLRRRDLASGREEVVELGGGRLLQWVAIAPDGATLVTSRRSTRPMYELHRVAADGAVEPLQTSHSEWMQLPRVSEDGARVMVSEQAWSNRLIRLDLRSR